MSLYGPRSPKWIVEHLDEDDNPIGVLPGWLPSSSFEIVATDRLGGHATLNLRDTGTPPDFLTSRARFRYDPGTGDEVMDWGVWLLSSPALSATDLHVGWQVGCSTKMLIIDEDGLIDAVTYPAGTPVIQSVVDLIQSTGETRIATTDTDATLSTPMSFDAGESKLTVINKLLETIAYWGLYVDNSGVFQVQPWVAPKDRQPTWVFEHGPKNLARADYTREQNLAGIPNRVICRTRGDDDEPALVGVAQNISGNPYSIEGRGRVIQRVYDVEATSQSSVDALAAMYLENAMSPILKSSIETAVVPLNRNDVIGHAPQGQSAEAFTVQRIKCPNLTFDAHLGLELRGVNVRESGPPTSTDSQSD